MSLDCCLQQRDVGSVPQADRVRELDGVRGIAILLVLVFHFFGVPPAYPTPVWARVHQALALGWCGVDLFFVLSGFLITGILLDTKGSANYFSAFYARRAVRILPLYYLAVFTLFLAIPCAAERFDLAWTRIAVSEQVWYWLHVSNWRTAFDPLVYPEASHLWSLAIEEQFYLVWPAVVLVCSRRILLRLCVGVILACCLLRNTPTAQMVSIQHPNLLYRLTPFRIDSLVFGACAALIARDPQWSTIARRYLGVAFAGGVAATAITIRVARSTAPNTRAMTGFGYSALALTFASIVLYAFFYSGSRGVISKLFRSTVLTRFGKYSYAIYVFHAPLLLHLNKPVALLATYFLALVSWNGLERHFLRLRRRFSYQPGRVAIKLTG
jgi:peptidoglycan/LPS O-acetylase OafA/YrhL